MTSGPAVDPVKTSGHPSRRLRNLAGMYRRGNPDFDPPTRDEPSGGHPGVGGYRGLRGGGSGSWRGKSGPNLQPCLPGQLRVLVERLGLLEEAAPGDRDRECGGAIGADPGEVEARAIGRELDHDRFVPLHTSGTQGAGRALSHGRSLRSPGRRFAKEGIRAASEKTVGGWAGPPESRLDRPLTSRRIQPAGFRAGPSSSHSARTSRRSP